MYHAKEVPVGVLEHNEISSWPVAPGVALGAKSDQSLYLARLIARVKVEVHPVPCAAALLPGLERKVRPLPAWILEDYPAVRGRRTGHVVERSCPESRRTIKLVAMNHYRANAHELFCDAGHRSEVERST